MTAPWAPEADPERLPPARAAACRELAGLLGFVHACPLCAARLEPGDVVGFMRAPDLERHMAEMPEAD